MKRFLKSLLFAIPAIALVLITAEGEDGSPVPFWTFFWLGIIVISSIVLVEKRGTNGNHQITGNNAE